MNESGSSRPLLGDARTQTAAEQPAPENSPASARLVLLATLPGTDRKAAEEVANGKLRAAKDLAGFQAT